MLSYELDGVPRWRREGCKVLYCSSKEMAYFHLTIQRPLARSDHMTPIQLQGRLRNAVLLRDQEEEMKWDLGRPGIVPPIIVNQAYSRHVDP